MRTVVLYTFHQLNAQVAYFLKYGINEHNKYVFIINNPNLEFTFPNVDIIKRENKGYDFGAWSDVIENYLDYEYFIFLNSSIVGPLLPDYYTDNWTDIFTSNINDQIKLFGSTINCYTQPKTESHVQSFIFCTDKIGLNILRNTHILTKQRYPKNFWECIMDREIRMSREIIKAGYNIGCLLQVYKDWDFRNINKNNTYRDINWPKSLLGEDVHPYEIIFMKANRNFNNEWLNHYLNEKLVLTPKIVSSEVDWNNFNDFSLNSNERILNETYFLVYERFLSHLKNKAFNMMYIGNKDENYWRTLFPLHYMDMEKKFDVIINTTNDIGIFYLTFSDLLDEGGIYIFEMSNSDTLSHFQYMSNYVNFAMADNKKNDMIHNVNYETLKHISMISFSRNCVIIHKKHLFEFAKFYLI